MPGEPASEVEALDQLSTEELRHRAFSRAEHRLDFGFFWDLIRHLPASDGLAAEDGSAGNVGGSIAEVVELFRELTGRGLGDYEPMLRARFIDYLAAADASGGSETASGGSETAVD